MKIGQKIKMSGERHAATVMGIWKVVNFNGVEFWESYSDASMTIYAHDRSSVLDHPIQVPDFDPETWMKHQKSPPAWPPMPYVPIVSEFRAMIHVPPFVQLERWDGSSWLRFSAGEWINEADAEAYVLDVGKKSGETVHFTRLNGERVSTAPGAGEFPRLVEPDDAVTVTIGELRILASNSHSALEAIVKIAALGECSPNNMQAIIDTANAALNEFKNLRYS